MKTLILALLLLAVPPATWARAMPSWSYQEMLDKADLVVIALPTETKEASNSEIRPDFAPYVHVIGVETAFKVSAVLKGDKETKTLVLHHYHLADSYASIINGPNLASFDPKGTRCSLLFLAREPDGRYAPVTGQTDPTLFSVLKLPSTAR